MDYESKLAICGKVEKILRSGDDVIERHIDHNLVVNVGKSGLLRMLAEGISAKADKIAIGSGGVAEGNPFIPIAPLATDRALAKQVMQKTIDTHTYEYDVNGKVVSVTFKTLFISSEVNAIVSEVGIIMNNLDMFARHTFPSMYLGADKGYSLEILWTFLFE